MRYCSGCGAPELERSSNGATGVRHTCRRCGVTHYQRHAIVTGCIAVWEDQVLMCRRAIEPFAGRWTLPGGYVESGETLEEAAIRETYEEARASVCDLQLFALYDLPAFAEMYVWFLARMRAPHCAAGPESEAVQLCRPQDIPWSQLAFPMVREALHAWTTDRATQIVHRADFLWSEHGSVTVRQKR